MDGHTSLKFYTTAAAMHMHCATSAHCQHSTSSRWSNTVLYHRGWTTPIHCSIARRPATSTTARAVELTVISDPHSASAGKLYSQLHWLPIHQPSTRKTAVSPMPHAPLPFQLIGDHLPDCTLRSSDKPLLLVPWMATKALAGSVPSLYRTC